MRIASEPIIDLPLEDLTLRQKLDLFHHLREELGFEINPEPPEWHLEVLAERERMLGTGESKLVSLEQFAKELREKLS